MRAAHGRGAPLTKDETRILSWSVGAEAIDGFEQGLANV
jgi:hypothetical protein